MRFVIGGAIVWVLAILAVLAVPVAFAIARFWTRHRYNRGELARRRALHESSESGDAYAATEAGIGE